MESIASPRKIAKSFDCQVVMLLLLAYPSKGYRNIVALSIAGGREFSGGLACEVTGFGSASVTPALLLTRVAGSGCALGGENESEGPGNCGGNCNCCGNC